MASAAEDGALGEWAGELRAHLEELCAASSDRRALLALLKQRGVAKMGERMRLASAIARLAAESEAKGRQSSPQPPAENHDFWASISHQSAQSVGLELDGPDVFGRSSLYAADASLASHCASTPHPTSESVSHCASAPHPTSESVGVPPFEQSDHLHPGAGGDGVLEGLVSAGGMEAGTSYQNCSEDEMEEAPVLLEKRSSTYPTSEASALSFACEEKAHAFRERGSVAFRRHDFSTAIKWCDSDCCTLVLRDAVLLLIRTRWHRYEKASSLQPEDAEIRNNLAACALSLSPPQPQAALQWLAPVMEKQPADVKALLRAARASILLGQVSAAPIERGQPSLVHRYDQHPPHQPQLAIVMN